MKKTFQLAVISLGLVCSVTAFLPESGVTGPGYEASPIVPSGCSCGGNFDLPEEEPESNPTFYRFEA